MTDRITISRGAAIALLRHAGIPWSTDQQDFKDGCDEVRAALAASPVDEGWEIYKIETSRDWDGTEHKRTVYHRRAPCKEG